MEEKERPSFLEKACRDDAELRGEVESLLEVHGQADGFLGKSAMQEVANELRDEPVLLLGPKLGPYQIQGV